ncbi:MAG: hypothetical protein IJI59_05860 [Clostridia bacterium]|nr:hypothetical protein [Clostridia bacterium]
MNSYAIMHIDRHVATIRGDGSCTIYFPRFMPYNLYLEKAEAGDMGVRMNNLNNFYYWCATRLLTLDRVYAKEILNSLGLRQAVTDKDRAEIAISYHALCLTDVYWVRGLRERITYAEINLYDHSLSDAFVDVALRGRSLTAQNAQTLDKYDSAGDLATAGVAPKAWVRRDGAFWLLKDGDPREVEAELTASRIARCFDVEQVFYEPEDYQGQRVSASRLATAKERSIVPMAFVEVYAANVERTAMDFVNRLDLRGYHMMNIVDYLVGNTDRHWGNWGFWVDNRDNRLTKLHPLMDFNKAFHAYDSVDGARCLTTKESMSQKDAAVMAVKAVGLNLVKPLPGDLPSLFRRANATFGTRLDAMFKARLDLLNRV